jgi:hypothetical protein
MKREEKRDVKTTPRPLDGVKLTGVIGGEGGGLAGYPKPHTPGS